MASIGVHVYGGSPNSASVIGPLGNEFKQYITAFKLAQNVTSKIQFVTVPAHAAGVELFDKELVVKGTGHTMYDAQNGTNVTGDEEGVF
jgi:hypothetical protein